MAATATCRDGIIVPAGWSLCQKGPNGNGGAMASNATCVGGVIVPPGWAYCAAGSASKGGAYDPRGAHCANGKIVIN